MGLTLVTAATSLPVSRDAAKRFCQIEADESYYDALVDDLLAGAVSHAEALLDRALGEQVWRLTLDCFSDTIELSVGPVLSVVSVTYLDADGILQTVDPGDYTVDLISNPAWIVRNSEASWPDTLDAINAVRINFTAGWIEATLPKAIRAAIYQAVATQLDARGDPDRYDKARSALETALRPWRRIRI